jgi:hypothetical protein
VLTPKRCSCIKNLSDDDDEAVLRCTTNPTFDKEMKALKVGLKLANYCLLKCMGEIKVL